MVRLKNHNYIIERLLVSIMNRIAVLMSTYNGEKYIEEQLDSILNQESVDVSLYIRDDGSTDGTCDVLKKYEKKSNVYINYGSNLGVIRAYEKLIMMAPKGYNYYAFSDQDDIWYRNKLSTALQKIEMYTSKQKPLLYCCNQNCVDENGQFIFKRLPDEMIQTNIIHSMLENHYSGCTMVFNKNLLDNVRLTYMTAGKSLRVMYDAWFFAVAQASGCVIYDKEAHIDFRRHDNNATQAAFSYNTSLLETKKILKRQINNLINNRYYRGYTKYRCKLLLKCFGYLLNEEDRKNLRYLSHYNDSLVLYFQTLFFNPLRSYFFKPKLIVWMKFMLCLF